MSISRWLLAGGVASLLGAPVALPAPGEREPGPAGLYREHCASCHGDRRYGGYASPLIPGVLERMSDDELVRAIREGLPSTQMEAFGEVLGEQQARALVALLREPVGPITWSAQDIAASRLEYEIEAPAIPPEVHRENLILVVERGTGSVSVLEGDSMVELDRFAVGAIHGGLKFDRDFRVALAATRDGTLVDYDLVSGGVRAKVKLAVNTRNVAISPDGAFLAAANQLPASLVILDGSLQPLAVFPLPGQPSAVYPIPGEDRFVLTLRDLPRLYTLAYPELTLQGLDLPQPFQDFTMVPGTRRLIASSREGKQLLLYDLGQERVVAELETEGLPHLFSGCFFSRGGVPYAAFGHIGTPRLSVIDMRSFRIEREIPLRGSGFFVRTHPGSPYLWADTNTEEIQLVEKQSLKLLARTLRPEAGKKAMHVEFTARGEKALVSVWHQQGAVVIYDSTSLDELGRLPYAMPVGKYNPLNKTRFLR